MGSLHSLVLLVVAILICLPPFLWALFRFSFVPAKDVIGLWETKLATLASLVLASAMVLLNVGIVVRVVGQSAVDRSVWIVLCAVPSAMIVLMVPYNYLMLNRRFGAAWRSATQGALRTPKATIESILSDIAEKLGLERAPTISLSAEGSSPFCYGRSARRSTMVIPSDLEAVCLQAASGDARRTMALVRFVLGHELAHIKHGDCAALSLLSLFYGDLRLLLLVGAPYVVGCVLAGLGGRISGPVVTGVFLTLACMPVLRWLLTSIARHREFLADARSLQLLDPDESQFATHSPVSDRPSPFEFLILYYSGAFPERLGWPKPGMPSTRALCRAALSWAGPAATAKSASPWRRLRDLLTSFHPAVNRRTAAAQDRAYAGGSPPIPSWSAAVQIQIVASLSFALLSACLFQLLSPLMAVGLDDSVAKEVVTGLWGAAGLATFVFFPALAFSMPARTSSGTFAAHLDYLLTLARRYAVGAGAGLALALSLVTILLAGGAFAALSDKPARVLLAVALELPFGEFMGLAIAAVLCLLQEGLMFRYVRSLRFSALMQLLPCLLAWAVLIVPMPFFLSPIEFVLGVGGGCIPVVYLLRRLEAGDPSQHAVFVRIGRLIIGLEGPAYRRWSHLLMVGFYAVPWAVACWLMAFLWHQSRPFAADVFGLSDIPTLVIAVLYVAAILRLLLGAKTAASTTLVQLMSASRHFLRIAQHAGRPISVKASSDLMRLLEGAQNPAGAFPNQRGSPLAFMQVTYYACYCLEQTDGTAQIDTHALKDWVNSCHCREGGYAFYPGGIGRLRATYWAARILDLLGHPLGRNERDIRCVLASQTDQGSFADPNDSSHPIQQTWYAVKVLQCLGAVDVLDHDLVGSFAADVADRSTSRIEDAVWALDILDTIDRLDEAAQRKALDRFIRDSLDVLRQIPVLRNLSYLRSLAELLVLTGSVDPKTCGSALGLLAARASEAFEAYLQDLTAKKRPFAIVRFFRTKRFPR